MRMDYRKIKAAAAELGVRVPDLLAMAPKNDPFYTGTPRDIEMARWFKEVIWNQAGFNSGVHLRRAHYWAVSVGGIKLPRPITHTGAKDGRPAVISDDYLNSKGAWKYLCQAAKMARYLGLVQISSVVDMKNPDPIVHFDSKYEGRPGFQIDIPELEAPYVWIDLPEYADLSPYLVEVWAEKSTMNDVLEPVCSEYSANLVTFQGEASITACYDLMQRAKSRPNLEGVRVFYISDFDPAGNSMPKAVARKLEWMAEQFGIETNIKLRPLALTAEQVESYNLPRVPGEDLARIGKFEEAFGEGVAELDAMEAVYPGELGRLVRANLREYFDSELAKECRLRTNQARSRVSALVQEVTGRYQSEISALENMQIDLENITADLSDLVLEEYFLYLDEQDDWMFDSNRDYLEQIPFYKEHAGRESVI